MSGSDDILTTLKILIIGESGVGKSRYVIAIRTKAPISTYINMNDVISLFTNKKTNTTPA